MSQVLCSRQGKAWLLPSGLSVVNMTLFVLEVSDTTSNGIGEHKC